MLDFIKNIVFITEFLLSGIILAAIVLIGIVMPVYFVAILFASGNWGLGLGIICIGCWVAKEYIE